MVYCLPYENIQFLLVLAILPGLALAAYVYKQDRIEKEPFGLLIKLFIFGAMTTISAGILESVGITVVSLVLGADLEYEMIYGTGSLFHMFILTFFVIGLAEEGGKYLVLKKVTWKHSAFDYRFDGIVYAVAVGIGFALAENVMYVINYGILTALVRMISAIPGHTIFAIFMGHFYGEAKRQSVMGNEEGCRSLLRKAFLVPVAIHGFYDLAAIRQTGLSYVVFWVFLILTEIYTFRMLKRDSANDTEIYPFRALGMHDYEEYPDE